MAKKILNRFVTITIAIVTIIAIAIAITGCTATSTSTAEMRPITTATTTVAKTTATSSTTTNTTSSTTSSTKISETVSSNDDIWAKCPRFSDEYNAFEWYVQNHSEVSEDQKSVLANETDVPKIHSSEDDWQVYPAIIGGTECYIYRQDEYILFETSEGHRIMQSYHIHRGRNVCGKEIYISESLAVFYDSKAGTVSCYKEGHPYWVQDIGIDYNFCGVSETLGFVFHNPKTMVMKIVECTLYNPTIDEVVGIENVLVTDYFAGSTSRVPLVMMNDGSVMIYFGDHYTGPLQRLYEGDKVDLDRPEKDFGGHVLRKPRFDMGAVPWAGDTGL